MHFYQLAAVGIDEAFSGGLEGSTRRDICKAPITVVFKDQTNQNHCGGKGERDRRPVRHKINDNESCEQN